MPYRSLRAMLPVCAVCFATGGITAQYWAKDFGGLGGDAISDVKVGPDGFIYAIGEFSATMDVNGTTYSSAGGTDVFVVKMDDAGNLIWLVQAGGYAIDRGGKVVVDGQGNLAVTGQFMGTADLFGTTLQSAGNTFDFFVALLNTSDGSAQWVRTGGGPVNADKANGVCLSPNGNVTIVGEFRGDAVFDGGSLSSIPDPFTLQPSVDVFVAGYDPNGNALWLKQGAAEFTDRGIDVVADASNNLYVCGQFSDTIQFDQVHNNAMYNSVFLLKLDAGGNEQWFRRCGGGAFNHVRDMQLTSTGELLVAGDLQGNMLYADPVPQLIQADDAYNYFLLRVGLNGALLGDTTVGSANPITLRGIDQRADTLAVYGEFECQLTAFSTFYDGNGLFMATGPQDLFIAKHRLSNWTLLQAQQFGGQKAKRAGGIASLGNGELVFGGKYEKRLHMPSDASDWGDEPWWDQCGHFTVNDLYLDAYCGDSSYTLYSSLKAEGLSDAFLGRAFVKGRTPYDVWQRRDTVPCSRSEVEICIRPFYNDTVGCVDTLTVCDYTILKVFTPQGESWVYSPLSVAEDPGCLDHGEIGFDITRTWSDGSTGWQLYVNVTGWYWCTISTTNGCWSRTDSIYVLVHPNPPIPLVSDEYGLYTDAGTFLVMPVCDTITVWNTNPIGDYTAYWLIPDTVFNDSVSIADHAVVYFVSPEGCISGTVVFVLYPQPGEVPPLDSVAFDWFVPVNGDSLFTDTVYVCDGFCALGIVVPTWYMNGVEVQLDSVVEAEWSSGCFGNDAPPWQSPLTWSASPFISGWYTFSISGSLNNNPCGTDVFPFTYTDSAYIVVVRQPDPIITGPHVICQGGTIELDIVCLYCGDSLIWTQGQDTLSVNTDSALVSDIGSVHLMTSYTVAGLTCIDTSDHYVFTVEGPSLAIEPPLICAGDTALLWTNLPGTNYQWIGPNGPIATNNDTLLVTDFGDYFLTMTDTSGCVLTNGPIELSAFSSPYLDVQPDYVLCPGDSITISVMTNDPGMVVWDAPLSGNATSQTITQAGLYSCTIGGCIPQTLTAYIIGGSPNATILPDDSVSLCPGDSVLLNGANGEAVYLWDSFQFQQSLWVDQGGTYQLVVFDEVGCTDTAFAWVEVAVPGEPMIAAGDTVCQGMDAQLTATGSGQLVWFSDAGLTDTLAIGGVLAINDAQQSATYYVTQQDGPCLSATSTVELVVIGNASSAYIEGPSQVCVGDTLVLDMIGGPFASVVWNTPSGNYSADPLVIAPVALLNEGAYYASPVAPPCNWPTYAWLVEVVEPEELYIGPDTALCAGSPFTVSLPPGFTNGQWSNGASGTSATLTAPTVCIMSASDASGCTVQDTLVIADLSCIIEIPNAFSPNSDGVNDGWQVTADGFVDVHALIYNRWGQELYADDPTIHPWRGRDAATNEEVPDGVYFYALSLVRYDGSEVTRTGYIQLTR